MAWNLAKWYPWHHSVNKSKIWFKLIDVSTKHTQCQVSLRKNLATSKNESVKFVYHDSNISSNMQYSSYKSCKDVLKDIRDSKINKILTNVSSQSLIVKSLWNEWFNENIEHWYTSFQNLLKNIYNFSTRYINNTLPTLKNMTMWKKTSTTLCKFCLNSQTLQQVVSGCKVYLHEGRYDWHHDSISKNLVTYFKSIRGNFKYCVDIQSRI